jgi:predicted ATPase
MHTLLIKNFGPISECEIKLQSFTVLIGPQSSGKSTISKLMYFFLNIRDEYIEFALDALESNNPKFEIKTFQKLMRKRFVEFWGPTPLKKDVSIKYTYSEGIWIEMKLDDDKHKFINAIVSPMLQGEMIKIYNSSKLNFSNSNHGNSSKLFSTVSNISAERSRETLIEDMKKSAKKIFSLDKELLFIPAGRSLLSTLSDQLQYIHPHQLDYPMRRFIERINLTKSFFGKNVDDIIKEKQALESSPVWFSAVRKANQMIKRILKGEYIHDKDGGKLYVDKNTYTKINFASSGQQESIWILLSMFLIVLENVDALVFIEEPEAHLFPIAQKEIVEFMCYLSKSIKTDFVVTTHSPYILSAINNHIYAAILGLRNKDKVSTIIPDNTWLNPKKVNGYFINSGILHVLYDQNLNMFKTELIDTASDLVNQEYTKLLELESE